MRGRSSAAGALTCIAESESRLQRDRFTFVRAGHPEQSQLMPTSVTFSQPLMFREVIPRQRSPIESMPTSVICGGAETARDARQQPPLRTLNGSSVRYRFNSCSIVHFCDSDKSPTSLTALQWASDSFRSRRHLCATICTPAAVSARHVAQRCVCTRSNLHARVVHARAARHVQRLERGTPVGDP